MINCVHCGQKLIIEVYKGYKIIPEQWAHYFVPLDISCRTDKEFWSKRDGYRMRNFTKEESKKYYEQLKNRSVVVEKNVW